MPNNEKMKNETKILYSIFVDLIFNFLPFIILISIKLLTCSFENFFARSDLSYISMILYSQTLVKLFLGIIQNSNKKNSSLLTLIVSLILAFGLIPSILFLVIIELGKINKCAMIFQCIWLIISVAIYIIFGGFGLLLSENKTIKESDFEKTGE